MSSENLLLEISGDTKQQTKVSQLMLHSEREKERERERWRERERERWTEREREREREALLKT